jgi:hypothetical protein
MAKHTRTNDGQSVPHMRPASIEKQEVSVRNDSQSIPNMRRVTKGSPAEEAKPVAQIPQTRLEEIAEIVREVRAKNSKNPGKT